MIFGAKKIIVIGGNAAGPAAAAKAKRVNPGAEVILFEAGEFISTGTCELPYLISGEVEDYNKLVFFTPESFYKAKGVKVFNFSRVESISRKNRTVSVRDEKDNITKDYNYDSLVIASGSLAKKIPSFPPEIENVFNLKSVKNFLEIDNYLKNNPVENVTVIGAGYIGLESAEAFSKKGYKVCLVEKEDLPLPGYEREARALILDLLKKKNIEFFGGYREPDINIKEKKIDSLVIEGRVLKTDLILVAAGVSPNSSLALGCGIKTGDWGGILVDKYLQTSDPSVFAAGDVIEVPEFISRKNIYLPLATLAHSFGHTAGSNAAGGRDTIEPVIKNIALKLFDNVFTSVGFSEWEAEQFGGNVASSSVTAPNIVKVMPGSRNVFGKLVYDRASRAIYGASFFGGGETTGLADMIALLIGKKGTVEDLQKLNYNYTPPSSPFVNILSLLSRKAGK